MAAPFNELASGLRLPERDRMIDRPGLSTIIAGFAGMIRP